MHDSAPTAEICHSHAENIGVPERGELSQFFCSGLAPTAEICHSHAQNVGMPERGERSQFSLEWTGQAFEMALSRKVAMRPQNHGGDPMISRNTSILKGLGPVFDQKPNFPHGFDVLGPFR